jgi:hypothetical protein
LYGVGFSRFAYHAASFKYGVLAVAVVSLTSSPDGVAAQSRSIEQFGDASKVSLLQEGAFCSYWQGETSEYSVRFFGFPEQDFVVSPRIDDRDPESAGSDKSLSFVAGGDAAWGSGYLNGDCISGVPSRAVVGDTPVFANSSNLGFKDQEVGPSALDVLTGIGNESLKFRVGSRGVRLKFSFDF